MAMTMQSLSAKGSFVGKSAELKSSPAAKAIRVPVVIKAQQQDAVSGAAAQPLFQQHAIG